MPARPISRELIWNFLALGAANYGAMAVAFGVNAVLTRRLGVEEFGRFALLLTTSQVVSQLSTNWTLTAVVRFGAQEFALARSVARAFWTRVWISAAAALAASVAMLAGADRVAAYLGISTVGLVIVWAHFAASLVMSSVAAAFQARQEMRRYGTFLLLDKIVIAILVLVLPLSGSNASLSVLGIYAASSAIVAMWGVSSLGRSLWPIVFEADACRSMLLFSLPLIFSSWVGVFGTNWIDMVIIKEYRPAPELGWYSLGTLLAGVVQQITILFSTLLLPQLSVMVAQGETDRISTAMERLLPYWLLGTSVLFCIVLLVAGPLIPLVFGTPFTPSLPVLALLMVAASALSLFNAFSPVMNAFGATWALTWIYLASGVVNIAMDFALIPSYGIRGAAVATILAYATSAALALTVAQARLKGRLFRLAMLALPVVVVSACFFLMNGSRFYLVAPPAAALTVYWLIRRFGLFRVEDAEFVRDLGWVGRMAPAVDLST